MSDTIYTLIIAELLFVCGISIYFVIKLRQRLKRLSERLNPGAKGADQQQKPTDPSIVAYLVSQLKATRALPESELAETLAINPLITTIRSAYLNAERRALKHTENSPEYWKVIQQESEKIIGILSTEAKRTGAENSQLQQKIKLLRDRLEKLGDGEWVAQNAKQPQVSDSPGYLLKFGRGLQASHTSVQKAGKHGLSLFNRLEQQKQHTQKLGQLIKNEQNQTALEQKLSQYEQMLYKMEHESAKLQKALNDAKKRLAEVDDAFIANQPNAEQTRTLLSVIRASNNSDDSNDDPLKELLIDRQSLENQSRKNLDSLQQTIMEQRKSILAMESTINQLESDLSQNRDANDEKRTELEKLKRALMESNTCIQVLENEVETLFSHLQELQQQREQLQAHYQDHDDAALLATINDEKNHHQLTSSVEQLVHHAIDPGLLTDFMTNAIESGSLEDLITVLQQAVTELGYQSIIRLQVDNNKVDIASLGKLSKEDKAQIDHLEFDPAQPIQQSNQHISVHFRQARALLKPLKPNNPFTEQHRQYLQSLFSFSANLAEKVAAQKAIHKRLDNFEYFSEMLQTISANLEAQYRYQRDETQSIIQSIVDQSYMLVGEQATSGQQSVLKAMEEEAKQRTDLLDANRAIVRKQFIKMMEKLSANRR